MSTILTYVGIVLRASINSVVVSFALIEEFTRTMNPNEKAVLQELVTDDQPLVTLTGTLTWFAVWSVGLAVCGGLAAAVIVIGGKPVSARFSVKRTLTHFG